MSAILISNLYKNKEGKYIIKDLIREYCEYVFQRGIRVGIRNGIKIVIEDIRANKISLEKLETINDNKILDYIKKEGGEF